MSASPRAYLPRSRRRACWHRSHGTPDCIWRLPSALQSSPGHIHKSVTCGPRRLAERSTPATLNHHQLLPYPQPSLAAGAPRLRAVPRHRQHCTSSSMSHHPGPEEQCHGLLDCRPGIDHLARTACRTEIVHLAETVPLDWAGNPASKPDAHTVPPPRPLVTAGGGSAFTTGQRVLAPQSRPASSQATSCGGRLRTLRLGTWLCHGSRCLVETLTLKSREVFASI